MLIDRLLHRKHACGDQESAGLRFVFRLIARAVDREISVWTSITVAIVIAGGIVAGLAPLALKFLVDELATAPGARRGGSAIWLPVAAYVGALAAQRVFEQAQTYSYARGEQQLVRNFGSSAYAHLLALPLAVHLDRRSGALSQSLSQGVLGLRLIATHLTLSVAPVVVQLAVAGTVLSGVLGPRLGLLLLGGLIAYCVVFTLGIARLGASLDLVSNAQIDAGGLASDGLMNVETIKSYTAEGRYARRYDLLLRETGRSWSRFARFRFENGLAVAIVFGTSFSLILWMAGTDTAAGRLTVGAFILINSYTLQLVRPVEMIGFAVREIGQGAAYLREIAMLLTIPVERGPGSQDTSPQPDGPAELRFDHVSFGFGGRKTIDDVTFTAQPGTMVGIVGPSGAGKSSLMRLAMRFHDPWTGSILLDGTPLTELPLDLLRRQIALVSQDTILFNDTIAANIRFAAEDAAPADIAAAAGRAQLSMLLANLPDGLETRVGERGLKLSGGEKQRVAIARVLLKRARLIIYDEATAALDHATEQAVWGAMQGVAEGLTTLVVTHRLMAVSRADEILVLDHGRVVQRGTHSLLIAREGLYQQLWRSQANHNQGR